MLLQGRMNQAQYEILNMLSCINQEEDVTALKSVIVQFLNDRLQNELDRLWEDGTITEEKMSSWANEHMRTSYKKSGKIDTSYSTPTVCFNPFRIGVGSIGYGKTSCWAGIICALRMIFSKNTRR